MLQKPTPAFPSGVAADPTNTPSAGPPAAGPPELQAGAHLLPEDGACLMEYVSVLAGARFSDRPACTDPTLAELARLVNDASSDAGRRALAAFAHELSASPPTGALGTAVVVQAAVTVATGAAVGSRSLRRDVRRSRRRVERVTGSGLLPALARAFDPLYRQGTARRRLTRAVAAVTRLPAQERDAALRAALEDALVAAASVAALTLPRRRR